MLFSYRRYKRGSTWAVWRWKDILFGHTLYLRRLHILHTPIGGVMLHWIPSPDPQRDLHDHPVGFISFPLRGRYVEQTPAGFRWVCPLWGWGRPASSSLTLWDRIKCAWNIKRACGDDRHRIIWVHPATVTLVFYGPSRRVWGFHEQSGWTPWYEYSHMGESI